MFDEGSSGGASGATAIEAEGPGSLAACTARLASAVDQLVALQAHGLTDRDLAEAMVGLRRQQSRFAAALAELTAAFDARQVHRSDDGSRSATDWIAVHAPLPRPQAGREVRDARRLRTMPATRAAFRDGAISPAHVSALARLAGHPRAGQQFPEGEAYLVDLARTERFDDWKLVCDHWLAAADPDGPEQERSRDDDLRRFGIPEGLDGVGHPHGRLTRLATATVTGALGAIERELLDADVAEARAIHGEEMTLAHLARTPAQRRHDALVEMAVRAMAAPADGKRPAPLVTVVVDYPTLAGRVCELAGTGTLVAPGDIASLLGRDDTLIERVVFDGPNRVRDISTARTFRGVLRRIVQVMHRRCGHGTCFVPSHDCQVDHVVPWSEGGGTTQANGRPGCGPHNRWWYEHPEHRPPPPTLRFEPPGDGDDPGADPGGDDLPADRRRADARPPSPPRADRPAGSAPVHQTSLGLAASAVPRAAPARAPDLCVADGSTQLVIQVPPSPSPPALQPGLLDDGRWHTAA